MPRLLPILFVPLFCAGIICLSPSDVRACDMKVGNCRALLTSVPKGPPIGAPTSLGSHSSATASSAPTLTTTAPIIAGNLIVVATTGYYSSGTPAASSLSDGTNTYVKANEINCNPSSTNHELVDIWYAENVAAVSSGATITATFSANVQYWTVAATQISGVAKTNALGATPAGFCSGSSITPTISTGSLAYSNEVVVGILDTWGNGSATPTITEGVGFMTISKPIIATFRAWDFAAEIVNSIASVNWSPTTNLNYGGVVELGVSFVGAASSPSAPVTVPGFLYNVSTQFDTTNLLRQSNGFSTTPWTLIGATVAAPTLTANATTDPFGGNNGWKMCLPAISAGSTASVLNTSDGTDNSSTTGTPPPITYDIWIKGVTGTEALYENTSNGTNFYNTKLINPTTSWVRYPIILTAGSSGSTVFQLGVNLYDSNEGAQSAQCIYIYGAQAVQGAQEKDYIPTTAASLTESATQLTPIPFRDFSTLAAYSGNPVTAQNDAPTWNSGGTDSPKVCAGSTIAGNLFFAPAEGNNGSARGGGWNNIGFYTAPVSTPLAFTPRTAIITNSAGTWRDNYTLHPTCPIRVPAATPFWVIYFSAETSGSTASIGYASTTDDPPTTSSTWTVGSSPVISGFNQALPSTPIHIGNQWIMFPSVQNVGTAVNARVIDVYTSSYTDGLNWTLVNTALYSSAADWDVSGKVYDAGVIVNSHGWCEMLYTAIFDQGASFYQEVGYAISQDCIHTWYKWQNAPIIAGTNPSFDGDSILYETAPTMYLYTANTDGCSGSTCTGAITDGKAYSLINH
jgi:hypothetical protein